MAKKERAEIDLIINGESSTASIRDMEAAVRKLRAELRGMKTDDEGMADKTKRYQELNKELTETKVKAGLTVAAFSAVTGSLDDLQNQAYQAGKALGAMHPDDPELENAIIKYQTLNKTLEEHRGKIFANQTAVTGQKNAYNGLGVSINQLSREMPAFANSAQTGFMAISNNIPMLVDEINKLKTANIELAAQGQPTKSIMQQVAASIFSWGTAISVGVTLLTVYGKEIVTFIGEVIKGKQPLNELTATTNAFNEAIKNTELKNVVSGLAEMKTNINLAQKGLLDKNEVLKIYNDNLGKTFGNATDLNQAEALMVQKGPAVIEMMFKKATAAAAIEEASKKAIEAQKETLKASSESISFFEKIELTSFMMGTDARNKKLQEVGEKAKATKIKTAEEESAALLKIAKKFQTEAAALAAKNNIDYFGGKNTDTKGTDKPKKAAKDTSFDAELQAIIAEEETKSKVYIKGENEREKRERELAKQRVLVQQEYNKMVLEDKEAAEKEYLEKVKAIETELLETKGKAAQKELELERQKNEQRMAIISQASQTIIGIMNTVSNNATTTENAQMARAQKQDTEEKQKLKAKFDNKLITKKQYEDRVAGIDQAAEERQRNLQRQQAERQKNMAIFEVTLKAALAWFEYWLNPLNPAKLTAAIGASVQAAVVIATPLPSFFDGGYTGSGGSLDDNGGFMAKLHKDEYVVNAKALNDPLTNRVVDAIDKGNLKQVMANTTLNNTTNIGGNEKLEMLLEQLLNKGVRAEMLFDDERLMRLKKEQDKQQKRDTSFSA